MRRRRRAPPASSTPAVDGLNRHDEPGSDSAFPIVGVGASAGGFEAFSALLTHLPPDTGMAFVLVQHLDPAHDSALTKLLGRATSLPVQEVTNDLRVAPNHVYVIPPNRSLSVSGGALTLGRPPKTRAPLRSIDFFFEALAEDQRERAIGVILSGTATDGTLGLEAIKAEGGITFAQDDSARYNSMPRSAEAAGCVDFVLSPQEIAQELARIAKHPAVARAALRSSASADHGRAPTTGRRGEAAARSAGARRTPLSGAADGFTKIPLLLRRHSGVDFSLYKSTTVQRRIMRRMVLTKHDTPESYARFLQGNGKELDALYADVLIGVTGFFRNADAFAVLQRKVWPAILQRRGEEPIRVWTPGCSTGQEAYSLVMSFVEATGRASRVPQLQVFATDLCEPLLNTARQGLYPRTIARDLSPERLRRFFVEEQGGYRISKALRERVVFARHNVISDPPFSRLHLISCRNLLIYFEPELQKKTLPLFHYALKPGGFLFLGASESVGDFTELFEPLDKKHKIYTTKAARKPGVHLLSKTDQRTRSTGSREARHALRLPDEPRGLGDRSRDELAAQREADRVAVNRFAPPGVLINAERQILQFRGPTDAYLTPPSGKATFDVLKMARTGLMPPLRRAITKAQKENRTARQPRVRIEQDGETRTINLEVIPLNTLQERSFLIVFEDEKEAPSAARAGARRGRRPSHPDGGGRSSAGSQPRRIAELQAELRETRDYVQSIRDQHDAAKEELQAFTEEVQSANEELQSVNEELETSKEELESANEELITVNEELAARNTELNRTNSDLVNVQTSTNLPIVLLGRDLTIRRFSMEAEKRLNLVSTDLGRPISGIRHHLDLSDLEPFVTDVIETVRPRDRQCRDKDGRWFSLRVHPYLTPDDAVDGAVLVLVDITDLKHSEQAIAAARDYAEVIIDTVRDPLLVLDDDLRIERANRAFYDAFQLTAAETVGEFLLALDDRQWDIQALRALLEAVVAERAMSGECSIDHHFERLGPRTMLLTARRIHSFGSEPKRVLLAVEDVTERRLAEQAARRLAAIVESSTDAIISKDLDGIITTWNAGAERVFGYPAREVLGQPATMLIPPERHDEEFRLLERIRRGAGPEHYETVRRRKDGSLTDISLTVSPVKDADGRIVGASTIARDITQRRRAEDELRRSHAELRSQADELTRFNNLAVGRELRVIELKKEINELNRRLGAPPPYPLAFEQ